jgi:hypothetical protein
LVQRVQKLSAHCPIRVGQQRQKAFHDFWTTESATQTHEFQAKAPLLVGRRRITLVLVSQRQFEIGQEGIPARR